MVYNAMKLFMEINPQLFDDCSHEYTEMQNNAGKREKDRQSKWDKLAEQAKKKQSGLNSLSDSAQAPTADGTTSNGRARTEEIDPITQDSQKRLDALKLQDESNAGKERKQNSVSAA